MKVFFATVFLFSLSSADNIKGMNPPEVAPLTSAVHSSEKKSDSITGHSCCIALNLQIVNTY